MIVNVAGAGAGKTSMMADLITDFCIPEGKVLFCIAFTNAAAENIENKVVKKLGAVPSNIRISTIHSFLYQELIDPFYYFLYGKQFERLSVINLSKDQRYKNAKLSELENGNILHYTKIPEKAKWVAYQKSGDKREVKAVRSKLLGHFARYCAAIFVDEAQDISEDIKLSLEGLEKAGVNIYLYGDPKQDIKGFGCFKEIIENTSSVQYIPHCYRCPQIHLNLSNMLASEAQQQLADIHNADGSIVVVFESETKDIKQFINDGEYGLKYISMKRPRFETHELQREDKRFETLNHEVYRAMTDKWYGIKSEKELLRAAFYITEQMIEAYDKESDVSRIISKWLKANAYDQLSRQRYAQMASAFPKDNSAENDTLVIPSIESIKGMEAERCLFVLTSDLAPYLFGEKKEDNKTSHLLYVALTRSLDHLTIFVTTEVEKKYSKSHIQEFFKLLYGEDNKITVLIKSA